MLRGQLVGLRARHEADNPILTEELYDDVAGTSRADRRPWWPISPGADASRFRIAEPDNTSASFSVVELATNTLAGVAGLWNIDTHNRGAHIGIGLRPTFRGRGLGTDVVRTISYYAFIVLGLHRLQVDTLTDNDAMIMSAERVGFTREGVNRDAAWVTGRFADETVLGMLAKEWVERHGEA
jgi:RimJ/RimL family protein N-acetyltransferase